MDAFEICGIAVITAILAVTVRQYKPELAVHVSIAGGIVLLLYAVTQLSGVALILREAFSIGENGGDWLELVLKITGVAYMTQIASELCRDMNEGALALKTELCGRLMMLSCAAPALISLIRILKGLAEQL